MRFAPGELLNESTMRSMTEGRRLPFAPWRRSEPISSSSKRPTSLMMEELAGEEESSELWGRV